MMNQDSPENNSLEIPTPQDIEESIRSFSVPMALYFQELGLPTEGILAPIEERKIIIDNLSSALGALPLSERDKATYLTKFALAVTVGLFDGALNYLWDETIRALRKLAAKIDLGYFFSVSANTNSRYGGLSSLEDLNRLDDHDLLEVCRRTELLNDVNYRRLDNVNFMRNHASAAHPNSTEIDGLEMLSFLSLCLKYAITAEPSGSVIQIKRLLINIRDHVIPEEDVEEIGNNMGLLPQESIDDLLLTFFGMFVDPQQSVVAKGNIKKLARFAWNASTENRKYDVGVQFGTYRKNADTNRKEAAQEFLDAVGGRGYKDEDSVTAELLERLEALKSAHFGINNFYNEYPFARALRLLIPKAGIPRAIRPLWVKVIGMCFIGNGRGYKEGVDEQALPYYVEYLNLFTQAEIIEFLYMMLDTEFTSVLSLDKADKRARELVRISKSKTNNLHIIRALDIILQTPNGKLNYLSSDYQKALKFVSRESGK